MVKNLSDPPEKRPYMDQFKTGHTLEAVRDIGCSILPPAVEASLFKGAIAFSRRPEHRHRAYHHYQRGVLQAHSRVTA